MTQILNTALNYWKFSQHYQALNPGDRESFIAFVVTPAAANSKIQKERELMSRLIERHERTKAA